MTSHVPRIIALAPRGTGGVAVAVAAARAGALGMLDLEGVDPEAAREASTGPRAWPTGLGVRVESGTVAEGWLAALPAAVRAVCCIAEDGPDWTDALGRVARSGRIALAEVTTRDEAARAARSGAAGVILAGSRGRGPLRGGVVVHPPARRAGRRRRAAWVRGGIGPLSALGMRRGGGVGSRARRGPAAGEGVAAGRGGARDRRAVRRGGDGRDPAGEWGAVRVYAPPGSGALARLTLGGGADSVGDGHRPPTLPSPARGEGKILVPGPENQAESQVRKRSETLPPWGRVGWGWPGRNLARRLDAALRTEIGWSPGQAWPSGRTPRSPRAWRGNT